MKNFQGIQKIVFSILISYFFTTVYSQKEWPKLERRSVKSPAEQNTGNAKASLSATSIESNYKVIASSGGVIEQVIDGYKIKGFKDCSRPFINSSGQIMFEAETDKGRVVFINNKAVACHCEMQIGNETISGFSTVSLGKNGGYCLLTKIPKKGRVAKLALVINGNIAWKEGEALDDGYKPGPFENISWGADLYYNNSNQSLLFTSLGNVIVDGKTIILRRDLDKNIDLKSWITNWTAIGNYGDYTSYFTNNLGQVLIYKYHPSDSRLLSKEFSFFPVFENNKAIRLNNAGHIITSDLQFFDYKDAVKITTTSEWNNLFKARDNYNIDLPYDKLLNLKPLGLKNNKPYFDIIPQSLKPGDISLNDNDLFAFLQHYALQRDDEGKVIKDGWAIIAGKAVANELKKLDYPQPGDLVVYWNGSEYCHVGVVKSVINGSPKIDTIRSKWGPGAVYDHDPNIVPYDNVQWTVWRRINRPSGVEFDDVNQLPLGTFDCSSNHISGTNPKNNQPQDRKTDKGRHILVGCDGYNNSRVFLDDPAEIPGQNGKAKRVDKYYPKLDDKEAISKAFRLYDCRGFVFGMRSTAIIDDADSKSLNCEERYSQVKRILTDGYRPIDAQDINGKSHNGSLKWLETHIIDK